jgi:hypothetical protein
VFHNLQKKGVVAVIYDFWRLSVLRSSTPSMPIFGNRHRQKACLLTNTRMIHTHMFTGISALDLQKYIFPSGSSPMKSTFPWMQRHDDNYYKGEQLVWNKPTWNSLNTPALKIIVRQFLNHFHKDYLKTNFNLTTKITLTIKDNYYRSF